jgi:hypothetical protein
MPKNVERQVKMDSLMEALSILTTVILRKSIYVYHESYVLLMDFFPVLVSAIQFFRFIFTYTTAVSGMYSYAPMSSAVARHDR